VAEAAAIGLGLIDGIGQIDARSVGYMLFFLVAAIGYGVLAIAYSRRHPHGKGLAILGVFGAPVMIGLILLAIPHCWRPPDCCLAPDQHFG